MIRSMASPARSPLVRVFRVSVQALLLALVALVIVRSWLGEGGPAWLVGILGVALVAVYAWPSRLTGRLSGRLSGSLRLIALTGSWGALLWLSADAAYLAFPLFFLYLHALGRRWGPLAVLLTAAAAVIGLAAHHGWSLAGVVGPTIGAAVALIIGLGYEALAHESAARDEALAELLETQRRLAATEHESGVLAERARLAREIHDTIAQGLSSIQMLLHAAERLDADRPGGGHIVLARETAAQNLAEARRFIRELTPPQLEESGLAGALDRLATQWSAAGLTVRVRVSDAVALPMHVQTALLRIAQGALANVAQHSAATMATVSLELDDESVRFTIRDDGAGFDSATAFAPTDAGSDSFGLWATRSRVEQLGGDLSVESAPGAGTAVIVTLPRERVR